MTAFGILSLLSYVGGFIALCVTIGGIVAFRAGYIKQIGDTQDKTITALKALNEAQETQLAAKDKEIARLNGVIDDFTVQEESRKRIRKHAKSPLQGEKAEE